MKTTVEIEGYEIVVSSDDDRISVMAMLDEEVVEEFTVEMEEGEGVEDGEEGDEDLKAFGDEEGEVEDFEDDEVQSEDEVPQAQFESFSEFVKNRK